MTTPTHRPTTKRRRLTLVAMIVPLLFGLIGSGALSASAASYARISGNGSSWAGNAVNQWLADVKAQGVTVDYTPDGSSSGRKNFAIGLSDFAVSEIPYKGDTGDKQDTNFPNFKYSLLPVVAGGTSFMYNLQVNGKRLRTLKLTQATIAGIFSGQITSWNDKSIAASNPGVNLPAQRITVVVRSDGSGATAQFTLWMLRQYPKAYAALCAKTGCDRKSATSYFPYQGLKNFTAQSGSNGVTTYTSNTPYTINYDEYSYALGVNFPVANVQNAAGFYTVPTDTAVAVALTKAKINTDKSSANYLSQNLSDVYSFKDPRTYPISAYSYLVVPAQTRGNFNKAKGATLGYFGTYALCEGQRKMGQLGYSPLPMNLVLAAMNQVDKIPGINAATQKTLTATRNGVASGKSNPCNNPTFRAGDDPAHNVLVDTAPFPAGCAAACQAPWAKQTAAHNGSGTNGATSGKPSGGSTTAPVAGGVVAGTGNSTTGTCAAIDTTCTPSTGAVGTTAELVASPRVVPGDTAWGTPQLALALSVLLVLALIIAPPVVTRLLEGSNPGDTKRKTDRDPGTRR